MTAPESKVVPDLACQSPDEAIEAMMQQLSPVSSEVLPLAGASGRITAQPIIADRPNPPSDVSAMDGYALRLEDAVPGRIEFSETILPGRPAPTMPEGCAVRIMTGAVVPRGAGVVIKREDVEEHVGHIEIPTELIVKDGQNIRRCGENLGEGELVVPSGRMIDPVIATALASFDIADVSVYRRVRVALIVTGDELRSPHERTESWQIRDSNGPALHALLAPVPWIERVDAVRVKDAYSELRSTIEDRLPLCDALFVTGGVSAGTHDFVPEALSACGCRIIFHKLPQRPGRPILGAIGPQGQLVLGFPGNPQSVLATARRIGVPLLQYLGGFADPRDKRPVVSLVENPSDPLGLWWFRPVSLKGPGVAELITSKGSGDVVGVARSDGFVEIPPNHSGIGPWPYYNWAM